ncbi:serine protease [Lysobacter helvus]|uniref:Serine protease n=2 Tax=Lysobacteraceae TaxID=32033 RepID=A0ABN6FSH6_9GAMM|nr:MULTISPECIES: S8 family serine peptidase [Lysobacter]BCT92636.1 serine protease [Lysobacter caseinilyticus]BCT95789.1 serine protease [Lysobacter helvus]
MRALAALLLGLAFALCSVARAGPPDVEARQLLVMLRAPAVHDRPDTAYAGDYRNAPGHAARARIAQRLATAHGLTMRTDWPMPALGLDCFVLEAPDAASVAAAVAALAQDPRVESVQAMQRFEVLGAKAPGDPLSPAQPVIAQWRLQELHAFTTGKGVSVAVIDTGVASTHPDLKGQVVVSRDFINDKPTNTIAEAHGTEVAGLIAARADNRLGIAGVAPGARLYALRACREDGPRGVAHCSSFTLAKALQFSIEQRVRVLNLSLSGPPDVLLARLIDVALRNGANVVAAVDARAADGGFPASHRDVLAVAGDARQEVAFAAVVAPATALPTTTADGGWGLVDGASFAAAQVSGLVALLRQRAPRAGSAFLRDAVAPPAALGSGPARPHPVDACAAVARAQRACACGCGSRAIAEESSRH